MSYIETFPVQHSTIMRLYSEKDEIMMHPDYQRMGGVWTLEKKQLLIDSLLNDYDIPKIYLHSFSREQKKKTGFAYAVIDGRQRLETIWQFIEGRFALSDEFIYQDDPLVKIARLGYSDIAANYPKIKIKFDSFVLPVIGVETDDQELIEDMFSRLNEAVPLNAAEKRNAIGGELVSTVRDIASHPFFERNVAFGNRRFQHLEVAARYLLVEENLITLEKIIDTKKEYLDALARNYRNGGKILLQMQNAVFEVLEVMAELFLERDDLLRAQGNMVLYYLLCKSAIKHGQIKRVTRQALYEFRETIKENRELAEANYADARFDLLEYDRLSQQGTNDASNIRERLGVICKNLNVTPISV